MHAIILAGGRATRLPDAAKDIPKILVSVAGKTVLEHQAEHLLRHGVKKIRFALSYRADQVINYINGRYEFSVEPEALGTGGAIRFASRDLQEPFLVLNGDVISDTNITDLASSFQRSGLPHVVTLFHVSDARSFGLVKHESGEVKEFLEKPQEKVAGHINAGIYILSPEDIQAMPSGKFSIENDFFPLAASSRKLGAFIHKGTWIEMGTEERLADAQRYFNKVGTG